MNEIAENILMHYGVSKLDGAPGRGSGRYPLGSGDNPNQHSGDFLSRVKQMREDGITFTDPKTGKTYSGDTAIAKALGMSTTQFRAKVSLAKDEERSRQVATARRLRESGMSLDQVAKEMGFNNDSSVRSLLNEDSEKRMNKAKVTADFLKEVVDKKKMVEVGAGVELELGISREKMRQALEMLKTEGYEVYGLGVPQVTNPGQQTNIQVLCVPGTPYKEAYNYDKIGSVKDYDKMLTEDGSAVRPSFVYPSSLDSKRLQIRYAEQGGTEKDGLVEIRPGVKDLSLGNSTYAQVRIMVDGTHFIKGMAVYNEDLPQGVDVLFNTNKHEGTPVMGEKDHSVLKPIKKGDPNNPFGSLIKEHGGQSYYDDPNGEYTDPVTGKKQSLSLINKRAEEGDWGEWGKKLPSQFLAKQSLELVNKQLNLSIADKKAEYDEICSLTNPTVKKAMLNDFAENCDSAAVHLKAAALPRMQYQVIVPIPSIGDKEVYAPNYRDGEKVALVRYPHEGIYQIPILTVNNKNKEGKTILGSSPKDAVGISKATADVLSGADFDGDTVMVIPTGRGVKIQNKPPLKDLEGFDTKESYGPDSTTVSYQRMKDTQKQMGVISNLIMDMTLGGASDEELARATKHAMVVIDAEKHNLDYKRSEKENGIAALKRKYQGHYDENGRYKEGAGTLLTRAKSQTSVLKRQGAPIINEDGTISYKTADKLEYSYVDKKTGKLVTKTRTQKSTKMAETDDARTLLSDNPTPKEEAYADYANTMKELARQARREMLATGKIEYKASAKAAYQKEVDLLNAKLRLSELNQPREKQAQLIANSKVKALTTANPDMSKKEIKKAGQVALTDARRKVGAERKLIRFTDQEWEAVQSGAIHENTLSRIIRYADPDELRERATPRNFKVVSDAKIAKIKAMKASNYTNAQIADSLGISASTVSKYA